MGNFADIFDTEAERYDAWFDTPEGRTLFANELAAIRLLWRDEFRPALEVGVGTGRFAQALGVECGIDPAAGALRLAERRGIQVQQARGEALPFPDASFGAVLMIATLCFAEDAPALFREAARVLRPGGHLLVGDIPADSPWGKGYQRKKEAGHPFYRSARFYTVEQVVAMMAEARFHVTGFASTLTQSPLTPPTPEIPRMGVADAAGFVVILA
jgi:ubiquinone/menaquinone biosynthesis C-methylase UbiE